MSNKEPLTSIVIFDESSILITADPSYNYECPKRGCFSILSSNVSGDIDTSYIIGYNKKNLKFLQIYFGYYVYLFTNDFGKV